MDNIYQDRCVGCENEARCDEMILNGGPPYCEADDYN
jgi:hypothetical protein